MPFTAPSLPLALAPFAQATAEADTGGLLVVAIFIAIVAVVAVVMTRKPRRPTDPKQLDAKRAAPEVTPRDQEKEARRTAKALRRAAKGAIRVKKGGVAEHVDAIDFEAEPEELKPDPEEEVKAPQEAVPDKAALDREKVRGGLAKTKQEGFVARLGKLFAGKQIDADLLDEIEEVLYRADLGVQATTALLDALKSALSKKELQDADRIWSTLHAKSLAMLTQVDISELNLPASREPAVLMVVGVNGSGKTTTIGKLAHRYAGMGRKVIVAAGDTFRAAAVDQLEVWCERAGVPIYRGKEKQDPASVCYGAIERAKAEGFDLVICDTAGRLHTNANLMAELQKVGRVVGKAHGGAPDEVLLVLDATMGQNAVQQAKQFREAIEVTSIALTKLDGTAKGGVVFSIAETLKLPVKLIGVGEKMEDLRDFNAELFVDALFDRGNGAAS